MENNQIEKRANNVGPLELLSQSKRFDKKRKKLAKAYAHFERTTGVNMFEMIDIILSVELDKHKVFCLEKIPEYLQNYEDNNGIKIQLEINNDIYHVKSYSTEEELFSSDDYEQIIEFLLT